MASVMSSVMAIEIWPSALMDWVAGNTLCDVAYISYSVTEVKQAFEVF